MRLAVPIAVGLCLLAAVACQSPARPLDALEIGNPSPSHAVVYGSVLVVVTEDADAGSFWGGDGHAASGETYRLRVGEAQDKRISPPPERTLDVEVGREQHFVALLDAEGHRTYWFKAIEQLRWTQPKASLGLSFRANPQVATYVGRLVIELPRRIAGPHSRPFTVRVEDARAEADQVLAARLPGLEDRWETAVELMSDQGQRTGRFLQQASAPPTK